MTDDKKKILIIDDERFYINILVELLSKDYQTIVAKNGAQAIERASDGPDLILLDIIMPNMDGYEVCRQLKENENTSDIPIIFLTVKSELNDEIRGFEMGAVDYINKPISPAIVKARIATHLALHEARKTLHKQNKSLITEQVLKNEQLRRSEKTAALGKLTGGIAHDFNNILGVILGYADLMQNNLPDNTPLTGYLAHICKAGERGKNITQKLLAFSRQKASKPESIQINNLLNADSNMLAQTLTVSIKLVLDLENNVWPIFLDKSDLQDAILNMCINAMHAMPTGGVLTIATRNKHIAAINETEPNLPTGDYVVLSLTDTGCGMELETQKQIFDPFFSTKGEKGTGLGMSQVCGFVNRSNGSAHVKSNVGRGTCITLYFPHHKNIPNNSENKNNACSDENDYSGFENILIVDDEAPIADMLEEILTNHGYHVLCALNAEAALKILESGKINLILSDVIMPEMSGYEFAEIVLNNCPEMKVQLLSGSSKCSHPSMANSGLHQQILQKPVHSKVLLKRVRELLDS